MTCIVGIERAGRVVMGGDRCVSDEFEGVFQLDHAKVWAPVDGIVLGASGELSGLQSMCFALKCPTPPKRMKHDRATKWIYTELRPRMIDALDGKTETGFMVGLRGRLYVMSDALEVCYVGPEFAMGSGGSVALGALHATGARTPRGRIMSALNAASAHRLSVAPPFDLVEG